MGTVQTEYHCILLNIRKQKYHSKIILVVKVNFRKVSGYITDYLNYMFHFLWRNLLLSLGNLKQVLLVLGFVVAVNIQQFQYSVFPFVPVLFGEFLAHQNIR